jgi:hypothetical protein
MSLPAPPGEHVVLSLADHHSRIFAEHRSPNKRARFNWMRSETVKKGIPKENLEIS